MLDIDAVLQVTRLLDPAGTRDAVARYVQEIEEMSQVLDSVRLPSTLESLTFAAAWPDSTVGTEGE